LVEIGSSFREDLFFNFIPPFSIFSLAAILVGSRDYRTQFWKGAKSQPNFAEMIRGWSPFKIVSVSAVLYPRWPPLLKIKISSNGQNCSILRQKVPKFELYKHNDELFNIYYGIFYEL
jgi:hypothetical protein